MKVTRRILGAAVAAALAWAGMSASQASEPSSYRAVFGLSAKGVSAGEFTFAVTAGADGAYEATAQRRLTGLARSLAGSSQDYAYASRGVIGPQGVRSVSYEHKGGKRGRVVRVAFTPSDVVTTATPAMGMGNPPATKAQRLAAMDQVAMFVSMVYGPGVADPCNRTLKVYMDGRARFDLVLRPNGTQRVNSRAFKGEAARCRVEYQPIAGFSDPQTVDGPLTFLFATLPNGMYAPLRIELPSEDAGIAVLEARSITTTGSVTR